ncbi:MAG: GNAT family N-acetyltransferase [Planctomycetota bacterium]|nr:GNAT family N-acetyltransferase [Planctomycetota bacterium]
MKHDYSIRPPRDGDELAALNGVFQQVFDFPPRRGEEYAAHLGREHYRMLFAGDELIGGHAMIEMGQFFGGRSVPTIGISLVAVAPHRRGRGAGAFLMKQAVREMHGRGVALSTLYPATLPLYRAAGYEHAGTRWEITQPLGTIDIIDRDLEIRPIGEHDDEMIRRLHRAEAMAHHGTLDRSDFMWWRQRIPRGVTAFGQLLLADDEPEGYVYYTHQPRDGHPPYDIAVSDVVVRTERAARRLLSFFADHRSMAGQVRLFRPPNDPLLSVLPEQSYRIELDMKWMLRIVDVEKALTARGYPPELTAAMHLDVRDDLLDANSGRFVLRIKDGRGEVEPGGEGTLDIDIRGLAMLYSGFHPATQLLGTGLLRADSADARAADHVFAGPMPWMTEVF